MRSWAVISPTATSLERTFGEVAFPAPLSLRTAAAKRQYGPAAAVPVQESSDAAPAASEAITAGVVFAGPVAPPAGIVAGAAGTETMLTLVEPAPVIRFSTR